MPNGSRLPCLEAPYLLFRCRSGRSVAILRFGQFSTDDIAQSARCAENLLNVFIGPRLHLETLGKSDDCIELRTQLSDQTLLSWSQSLGFGDVYFAAVKFRVCAHFAG